MSNAHPPAAITLDDIGAITSTMADLYDLAMYRKAVRGRLLDAMIDMIPCEGPCSVFQLDDFYSNGGRMNTRRTEHRNLKIPLGELMLKLWIAHVKRRDSPIERALFLQSKKQQVGAGRLDDLVDRDEWNDTAEGRLAARFKITDMAYMWVKCSDDELWAVALRRYASEPAFDDRERQIMEAFGMMLHHMRQRWYLDDVSKLTETQQKVLLAREAHGDKDETVARKLGMAKGTYKAHLRDIRKRLGTKSTAAAIAMLRMRYLPDDMS